MRVLYYTLLAFASIASIGLAADVLFPYMRGLKYSEYDQAIKLGLTGKVRLQPSKTC